MLDVLLGNELRNVAVVVTRYFGGTLLGTGGLVRAYSGAVKAGLDASVIITKILGVKLHIETDYTTFGKIQYILAQRELKILDTVYTDKVELEVLIPKTDVDQVMHAIGGFDMKQQDGKPRLFSFTLRDFLIFAAIFICALVLCTLLRRSDISDGFASPVFVLAVLLTSRFTNGYLFGTLAAFLSVIGINYIFTFPYWEFNFTMTGYPLTFFVMLCVSLVTCTMTTKIKQQEQFRMESEREKMRANLLRSVSHDIRTPLTSIIGSTSAILETPDLSLEQQHQLLEDVRDDAQWLVRVVENLLSITRMGEDTRITKQPEAAEEVLGEVARKFRKHYPDVKISVAVPDELLIVPMDAILIEQVMTNLLENAVRHGKNTTHIALSVHQEGENAVFAVQDNGGGIPPKLLPVLFSGTLRHSDTPTGDGKRNMGLGLSVCNAIVRAHGGTMHAQNRDGGAEFIFCLPMIEKEPELQ